MNPTFSATRRPAVAGQFYPGTADRLQASVSRYLAVQAPTLAGLPRAVIVPHAGYEYSGAVAGQLYAALRGRIAPQRVVVVAPSHRVGFRGISLGDYATLVTPLGDVPVDTAVCRGLAARPLPLVSFRPDAHAAEHALEVQLPFIQTVFPEVPVVPIVCGELAAAELRDLAKNLRASLWNADTLWVISSDFTHFGAGFGYVPFTRDVPRRIEELDRGAIDRICALDLDGFLGYIDRTEATICGHHAIGLLLAVIEPDKAEFHGQLVAYTTSGQLTHDWEHTVSYAGIAICTTAEPGASVSATTTAAEYLSAADKTTLLKLAREAIAGRLAGRRFQAPAPEALSPALRADGAAFVTLNQDNDLRGCIGNLEATEPLYQNVIRNARNAAFNDPRFAPVGASDAAAIEIDISVLTPAHPIAGPEEFIVGRHGIILEKGRFAAVFLPQVAPEQGWDRDATLTHLALKAGLPPDGWRRGATFSVFEAIVFSEKPG